MELRVINWIWRCWSARTRREVPVGSGALYVSKVLCVVPLILVFFVVFVSFA